MKEVVEAPTMVPADELLSIRQYVERLRPLLPAQVFAPSPRKLLTVAFQGALITTGLYVIRSSNAWWVWLLSSLMIGHSLACIAFVAHELSHNTVVRHPVARYIFEVLLWGANFISPTVWHRVHNHTHHTNTNTPKDPDRQFLEKEASPVRKWYTYIFYPNRHSPWWNFIVGFHFVPYIIRNIIAVFYKTERKPVLVPSKPNFTHEHRLKVGFELLVIALMQVGIFYAVGASWPKYLFASPMAVLVTSSIVMAYVFTNHFLNPLCEINDPLVSTTTVEVPEIFNGLHHNFSYHTEHHLFPGVSSEHYPLISALLREHFPERYNRMPMGQAWRRLIQNDLYVKD